MNLAPTRDQFLARRSFAPDRFQTEAMDLLDAGASVLVAAPTGSGKTLVAEYGIEMARHRGQRAFYTAPIKALSNQKFRDLSALYGPDSVGLVTGDNAINPDAQIVVMTTEVLRNMIYTDSSRLRNLGVVVLDEVHFLQDAYRGPVWEEVIIHLDPEVQLVCLSATVSNAGEVAQWLTTVRGHTESVVETRRPIELLHHFMMGDATTGRVTLHDTLVNGVPNSAVQRLLATESLRTGASRHKPGGRRGPRRRFYTPSRPDLVELLDDEYLLPAIVFIFSRAQCEDAVASCRRAGLTLTEPEERLRITEIVEDHTRALSRDDRRALEYDQFLADCVNGIASHHAGMIPMFKESVERCFVEGLIKVVFATETLAVGINMPARAVVIEKLTKFTGEHHQMLRASDFAQLTGRAGRRGLDDIGHAITLWNPFVTFEQVSQLALSRAFELNSAFRPTFNMAVNLVRSHSRAGTHHLLNLSFAQFQADKEIVSAEARLQRKLSELRALRSESGTENEGDVGSFEGESTTLASLTEVEIAMRALRPGDVVVFDAHTLRGRGVVLSTAARKGGIRLSVLTPSRKIIDVLATDFASTPVRAGHIELPSPFEPARAEFVREATMRLNKARVEEVSGVPVVGSRMQRPQSSRARRRARLEQEIREMQARQDARKGTVVGRFDDVIEVLETLGYVTDWKLTERGSTLAKIFHESDLLVVETITSSVFEGLSVTDLAAVVSCLVYEPRGADVSSIRWPSDVVRQRVKRIEKISEKIHDLERSRGMTPHRGPHGGMAWEASQWSSGRPLSEILDVDTTPGDFVRNVRQMIDLVRQISEATSSETLRDVCLEVMRRLDRGVVAASVAVVES